MFEGCYTGTGSRNAGIAYICAVDDLSSSLMIGTCPYTPVGITVYILVIYTRTVVLSLESHRYQFRSNSCGFLRTALTFPPHLSQRPFSHCHSFPCQSCRIAEGVQLFGLEYYNASDAKMFSHIRWNSEAGWMDICAPPPVPPYLPA